MQQLPLEPAAAPLRLVSLSTPLLQPPLSMFQLCFAVLQLQLLVLNALLPPLQLVPALLQPLLTMLHLLFPPLQLIPPFLQLNLTSLHLLLPRLPLKLHLPCTPQLPRCTRHKVLQVEAHTVNISHMLCKDTDEAGRICQSP